MKAFSIIIFGLLGMLFFSCEKEEEVQVFPTEEGGTLAEHDLAKVYVEDFPVEGDYFEGTFGDFPISLGRIPGDTLIFLVPEVGDMYTQLSVKLGNQIRSWDYSVSEWNYSYDIRAKLEDFMESTKDLQEIISHIDDLKELAAPYELWIDFFNQKYSTLTNPEKEFLAGTLFNRQNPNLFDKYFDSFEIYCSNSPSPVEFMPRYYEALGKTNLEAYSRLPKNQLNETILAGFGLSFWYQKLLMEYYSIQILDCPIIQDIKLMDGENELAFTQPFTFEAREKRTIGTLGVFKKLSQTELDQEGEDFFVYNSGFQGKEKFSKVFSELVEIYKLEYTWDLPKLNSSSIIQPPAETSESLSIIQNLNWEFPKIDHTKIHILNTKFGDEALTLILDSEETIPQEFKLEITLNPSSYKGFTKNFNLSSILNPTCPLSIDVLLIDKTNSLKIDFGTPHYTIEWSNGIKYELSQTLNPGSHSVKVRDSNGCEKISEFIVPEFGTVEDIDGNVYETVLVGDTWWMTENLRTTRLNNGTPINQIQEIEDWKSSQEPAFSWQKNDPSFDPIYGKFYNYYAICCDICPSGWRIPDGTDLSVIVSMFGLPAGSYVRGVNARPEGSISSNNQSGLQFSPGGYRSGFNGEFYNLNETAYFWTNYKDPIGLNHFLYLEPESNQIFSAVSLSKSNGYSVRCVK